MRSAAVKKGGEFSVENLAFKILRNEGYIEKLHNAFTQHQDSELSLAQ